VFCEGRLRKIHLLGGAAETPLFGEIDQRSHLLNGNVL